MLSRDKHWECPFSFSIHVIVIEISSIIVSFSVTMYKDSQISLGIKLCKISFGLNFFWAGCSLNLWVKLWVPLHFVFWIRIFLGITHPIYIETFFNVEGLWDFHVSEIKYIWIFINVYLSLGIVYLTYIFWHKSQFYYLQI